MGSYTLPKGFFRNTASKIHGKADACRGSSVLSYEKISLLGS
jgi:hypothetical protein